MSYNIAEETNVIESIKNNIKSITPYDCLEKEQISDAIKWIDSGKQVFRLKKPDIPNKHLVSYFVLLDESRSKVLLADHKKSGLWLPTGGHIEFNESPYDTVKRECLEELGTKAEFMIKDPLFLTQTITVGETAGHTDVSLWYLLKGSEKNNYIYDRSEFNNIKWFKVDEIPFNKTDPHMKRFIDKIKVIKFST